jgi:CHAT domain-containing protein/tetratricopeptide (TPR) repeat protein
MLRRLAALLLAALPLAILYLTVPGAAVVPGAAAEDSPTPQVPPSTPAVDSSTKARGEEALREAQASAQAGDAAGALRKLGAALKLYRQAGDAEGEAATLLYLAIFYRQGKQNAEALDYYQQALEKGRALNSPVFEAGVYLGAGDTRALLGQQDQAVADYGRALTLLRQMDDRASQRIALSARGNAYYALERYDAAAADYAEALAIAHDLHDDPHELTLLMALGLTHKVMGQPDQAMTYYLQALDAARAAGDRQAEAAILHSIGEIREDQRQYDGALDAYRQAASAARAAGDRMTEGMALFGAGSALEGLGRNVEALAAYEAALSARQVAGDRLGEALTLNNAGLLYAALGRSDDGLAALDTALRIVQDEGARDAEAKTLNNLGTLLSDRGVYTQALGLQQAALDIALSLGDRRLEASVRNNLGLTHDRQGLYAEASGFYEASLAIHREMQDLSGEASVLNNMAGQDEDQGRYTQALARYQRALDIFQELGNQAGAATALHNSAGIYEALGQYDRAQESYEQVLEIRRKLGDRNGEARVLSSLGSTYAEQGDFGRSLEANQQASAIAREIDDRPSAYAFLSNMGANLAELDRYDEALLAHEEALAGRRALGDRAGEGESLGAIAVVHTYRGEYDAAMPFFEQALAIEQELGDAPGEAITWSNMGYARRKQGQLEQALNAYSRSIALRERLRADVSAEELRSSLAASWRSIYEAAALLQLQLGKPEDAYATAERARARSFLDQLASNRLDPRQGADSELMAQETALRAELVRLDRRLEQERIKPSGERDAAVVRAVADQLTARQRDYDDLLVRLKLSNPQYAALVSADPLPLAEVQKLLRPEWTLVSYFVTGEQTLAFVIRRDSFEAVVLPVTAERLGEAVKAYRDHLALLDGTEPPALAQLSAWLIAPLKDKLITPVVGIAPHDMLHYLPFAALLSSDSPGPDRNGSQRERYLSEDHALFTLPSASVLPYVTGRGEIASPLPDAADARGTAIAPALVIAQPRAEGLPPLRFAEQEARAIAALYGVQPLVGDAATEVAFRSQAPDSRLIHIAAHGQLNTKSPLFSRLFLASTAEDDGALEVHEVYSLDLRHTDMVTLSACRTQLGSQSDGDDIVGLSRAFIYAGASTVVASLWSVDDEATASLMKAFYTHLRDGMGKAEALRAAQSDLRRDEAHPQWAHPFYWAAFVLMGDPGTISAEAPVSRIPTWIPAVAGGGLGALLLGSGAVLWMRRKQARSAMNLMRSLHNLPATPFHPKSSPTIPGSKTSSASAGCPRRTWLTRSQLKR